MFPVMADLRVRPYSTLDDESLAALASGSGDPPSGPPWWADAHAFTTTPPPTATDVLVGDHLGRRFGATLADRGRDLADAVWAGSDGEGGRGEKRRARRFEKKKHRPPRAHPFFHQPNSLAASDSPAWMPADRAALAATLAADALAQRAHIRGELERGAAPPGARPPPPPPSSSSSHPSQPTTTTAEELVLPDDQIEAILDAALMQACDDPAAGAVLGKLVVDLWARQAPTPLLASSRLVSHMLAAPLGSADPATRARAFDAVVGWALQAERLLGGEAGGEPRAAPAFRAWLAGVTSHALTRLAETAEADPAVWAAAVGALAHLCSSGGAWRAGLVAALAPPTPGGAAPAPARAAAAMAIASGVAAWPPHVRLHLVRLLGACLYGLPGEEGRRAGGGRWGVVLAGGAPRTPTPTTATGTTPLPSPPPPGLLHPLGGPRALVWLLADAGAVRLPLEARRSLACALLDGLLGGLAGRAGASAARALVAGGGPAAAAGADALAAWVRAGWAGCDADAVDGWEEAGRAEEDEGVPLTPAPAPPQAKATPTPSSVSVHATPGGAAAVAALPAASPQQPTPAARTLAAARVAAGALGARLPRRAAAAAAAGGPALAALLRAGAAFSGDLGSALAVALPPATGGEEEGAAPTRPPPTDAAALAAAALAESCALFAASASAPSSSTLLPTPEAGDGADASHPLRPCLAILVRESGSGPGAPLIIVSAARRSLERALLLEPPASPSAAPPLDTALATLTAAAAWVALCPPGPRTPAYVALTDALFAAVAPRLPPAEQQCTSTTRPVPDALDAAAAAAGGPVAAYLAGAAGTPGPVLQKLPVSLLASVLEGLGGGGGGGGGSDQHQPGVPDAAAAVSLLLLARCRADEAALAEAGGEAGLARLLGLSGGGAAGIDPRPRASVAAFLIDRLGADPARSGLLEAAVRRAGEGSPGAAPPSAAPMLEAAIATGLVSLESA